ncbi:MAG: hypothetical protein FD145_1533 [Candidatus Saganbacteria bacterium]|uniref:Deoxyhypusine synthase n=1 Tax=Candidatus Saganbacteria bacterium TaxID=2575572 RepID=A0A833NXX7_UNCSA|nr:MAG: hypothetical protein FD145_1533 [Candidatus Saganbacteria bacterium]
MDFKKIKTYSAKKRKTKTDLSALSKIGKRKESFSGFYSRLPDFLAVKSLKAVVKVVIKAKKSGRPVIWGFGAHAIKVGLSPIIIDLMKKGFVSCIATNGAGAIHDFELATIGTTSEDVAANLETGMFGMVEETQRDMNEAISEISDRSYEPRGLGALFGKKLMKAPHRASSVFYNAFELNIPATVHVSIGCDTIHMSSKLDPRCLGEASFNDFKLLCSIVSKLEGGVYLNIGSAVVLPEVFLKALTVARNLGNKVKNFTTVNMDMIQHYRPLQNVLSRPGGNNYSLTGHHEIMVPLLYQAILEEDN